METILLVIGVVAVALMLMRPAPQTQVIYVPLAVEEARGGLGCLPLVIVAMLVLVALAAIQS